jgi:hypothetical protein
VWLNRNGAVRGDDDPRPDVELTSLHGLLADQRTT